VCVWPDGRLAILDFEKLKEALRQEVVTERLVASVERRLSEILKAVRASLA